MHACEATVRNPPRDQARAALIREPGPEPVYEHKQPIAEPNEKVEVNDAPQQPRQGTRELDPAQSGNCRRSTNDRHRAVVAIPEWRRLGFTAQAAADEITDIGSFLFGDGGVRNIPEYINPYVLGLLIQRNDGQVIPDY